MCRAEASSIREGPAVGRVEAQRRALRRRARRASIIGVAADAAKRFIGSVRRECLDHVIVLTAAGLRRVPKEYVACDSGTRTHLGLDKDAPLPRPVAPLTAGRVIAIPQVDPLVFLSG